MNSTKLDSQVDDRYETEEYFVYVDLDTKLLDDQLSNSNAKIKFLGIDTENPIMQLNNQLFKGSILIQYVQSGLVYCKNVLCIFR